MAEQLTYAGARAALADALAIGAGDDWFVADFPVDRVGSQALIIADEDADALNHCKWRRRFMVGVVARRNVVGESYDLFDQIAPTIRSIVESLPGGVYAPTGSPTPPVSTELGGTDYLIQVHRLTIETTN